jgi:signal peptidase
MSNDPITTGDITVFTLKGQAIPIVHRVVKVHEKYFNYISNRIFKSLLSQRKEIKVLTKGDNNDVHDRGLYNRGQLWLEQPDFVGRVKL